MSCKCPESVFIVKKILIITYGPISSFHYHTTYWADYLTQEKIDFTIYDVHPMIKAKYNIGTSYVPDPLNDLEKVNVEVINSYSDYKVALAKLDKNNTLVVLHCGYEYTTYRIYRGLSMYGLKYCIYAASSLPSPKKIKDSQISEFSQQFSINNLIKAIVNCKNIKDILIVGSELFTHLPHKIVGINSANYILQNGTDSLDHYFLYPIDKGTKVIWGHCRDYDLYLDSLKNDTTFKDKQVVYVSTNLFHDVISSKINEWNDIMKPESYYNSLKKLFYYLEELGYTIVVAAHPREPISDLKRYLPHWEIHSGNTMQLVRESKFAIQLASQANLHSILYEKQFIMITSDSINKTKELYGDYLSYKAHEFGKKLLNIDHIDKGIALGDYLFADQKLIDDYISREVKVPSSPKLPLCQILLNSI